MIPQKQNPHNNSWLKTSNYRIILTSSKEIDRIGRQKRGKKVSQFSLLLRARAGFWFKGCTYHEFDAWVIRAPKDFVVLDHEIAVNHVAVVLHLLVHALHFVDGHRQSVCSPEAHTQGCCCDTQQQCPCSHRRFFPAAIIIAVAPPPVARWIDGRNLQQGDNSEFASATNLGFGAHAALLPLQTSNALWAGTWPGIKRVPSCQGQCGRELLTLPELNFRNKSSKSLLLWFLSGPLRGIFTAIRCPPNKPGLAGYFFSITSGYQYP